MHVCHGSIAKCSVAAAVYGIVQKSLALINGTELNKESNKCKYSLWNVVFFFYFSSGDVL